MACTSAGLPRWVTAADKDWALSPYRVHVTLGVDAAVRPQAALSAALAKAITERVDAVVGPLWHMELKVAEDAADRRQCLEPRAIPVDQLPSELKAFDKLMWLGVRATPEGYELRCREFDAHTERWGAAHERSLAQRTYLAEASFQILRATFAPLASIRPLADNDAQVQLVFKGSGLPRRADEDMFVNPGDVYQPLLRRTDRLGKLMENGVFPVPWTFLTAAQGDSGWLGDVYTGTRRPFGVQRGRTEQVAIALRNRRGPATVRFHARRNKDLGLAGYEVFRSSPDGSSKLIGVTDRNGMISVPPGERAVSMLLLRSGGQLLAKAPVPAGAGETLQIPIADDVARLRAYGEAQVLREELVDVVARRAIMMGRIRALLKQNRVDQARTIMAELDSLPTSSAFGRSIQSAQKKVPATDDPAVQRAIEKLFASTQELLAKFLSSRPIIELQSEVNAASGGS